MTLTLFVAAIVLVAALLSCASGQEIQFSVEKAGSVSSTLEGYRKGENLFSSNPTDKPISFRSKFGNELGIVGQYDNAYMRTHGAVHTKPGETTTVTLSRAVNMFGMRVWNRQGKMEVVFLIDDIEVQKFTSEDILRLTDDREHFRGRGSENWFVHKAFLNFACPNRSCMFNKIKIVAISYATVSDHFTVGLLDKRLRKRNTIKRSKEDEKENEKEI